MNQRQPKPFRRAAGLLAAGWAMLLLYMSALSPVGMYGLALLAAFDPDHHVVISSAADGMQLVLHHEGDCSTHRHGTVARALTMFAQPAGANNPDHVLPFGSAYSLMREPRPAIAATNESETIAGTSPEPVFFITLRPSQFVPPPRPPPDVIGNLLNVRFTVLLI